MEDITLRHTIIRDMENNRIVVPNSVISNEILVNLHMGDNRVCNIIEIGISYKSDVELAQKIIKEEIRKHPLYLDDRSPQEIEIGIEEGRVRVVDFGASSVNLRAWAWAWAKDTSHGFILQCDLLQSIKKRFDAEGIEIPYSHQNIILKKEKEELT